MSKPWVHISEHGQLAKQYIRQRQTGEIKSVLTPWPKVNNELLNGAEWGSVVMICGNSGSGKTLMVDEFTESSFALNRDQDFAVLNFQFEMLGRTKVMRDVSRQLGRDIKTLSSAFNPLGEQDLRNVEEYIDRNLGQNNIYVVDTPMSVPYMEKTVFDFYKEVRKPFIATLDHSLLVKKGTEENRLGILSSIGEMVIKTKKVLPVIWVILNQYNREYEHRERQVPNSLSAFPLKSDIYGGDPIYFAADAVIAIAKPDMYLPEGSFYGPKGLGLVVTSELLMLHVLKNRVGEPNTHLEMQAKFSEMRIVDPSLLG